MNVISNSVRSQMKYKTLNRTVSKLLGVFFVVLLYSCIDNQNSNFSSQGMNALDLSKYGKAFSIFVPDTVSSKLYVEEKVNGALEVRVGKDFAISINEVASDIEMKKQDIKDDEVNKLVSFILDSKDAIIWQSKITTPEHHFLLNKKIGDSEYSFEDAYSNDLKAFGKESIQKMFDSCKNVKASKD